MDLFEKALEQSIQSEAPLADRMRPRTLEEFVGQQHILAPGRLPVSYTHLTLPTSG